MSVVDPFLSVFAITERGAPSGMWPAVAAAGFAEVMSEYGGTTFEHGLYRLHTASSSRSAYEAMLDGFPELEAAIACFGFDWLGRQFAVDLRPQAESKTLLIDAGAGEALVIPASFLDFHNKELIEQSEAALAKSFFVEWGRTSPGLLPIPHGSCIGYKTPLFLDGADNIENLEAIDLEVYLSVSGQLRRQASGLPPGTRIANVNIE